MKKYSSFLLSLLALFVSCVNELPFNDSMLSSRLVMNAFFDNQADTNRVLLNRTAVAGDPLNVKDAVVSLYKNGVLCEQSTYLHGSYPFTTRYEVGDELRLVAKTATQEIQSTVRALRSPKIERIDTMSIEMAENEDDVTLSPYLRVKLRLKDLAGDNYYRVQAERIDTVSYEYQPDEVYRSYNLTVRKDDPILSDGYGSSDAGSIISGAVDNYWGIFRDTRFKDSEATLTFYLRKTGWFFNGFGAKGATTIYHFKVFSISEDEYQYMRVLNIRQSDTYIDGLYDPLIYPSNVQGENSSGLVCADVSEPYELFYGSVNFEQYWTESEKY